MAPVNTEKRCDMHLETASLQLVLFLSVLFELNGAVLFPDESQGICTRRIRYVVRSIDRGFFANEENRSIEYLLAVTGRRETSPTSSPTEAVYGGFSTRRNIVGFTGRR